MEPTISVEALRTRLEQGDPVTVLDIRRAADRAEWSIPGSRHLDVYDALQVGDAPALGTVELPPGPPVVVVCMAGQTSQRAARQLRARGVAAFSLTGGMRAWSRAWNDAPVPLTGTRAEVIQVRRTGKGCLSYLVG